MHDILIDPFESPKGLVSGAKEDLQNVAALIRSYQAHATCAPIVYSDKKTSHKFVKLKIVDPPAPRIRYLASGILNNLRHSLDQAANAASVELGADKRDGYFPFGKDVSAIRNVAKRNCRSFAPELTDYLLTFQAYSTLR